MPGENTANFAEMRFEFIHEINFGGNFELCGQDLAIRARETVEDRIEKVRWHFDERRGHCR